VKSFGAMLRDVERWVRANPVTAGAAGVGIAVAGGVLAGAGAAGVIGGSSNMGNAPTLAPGAWRRATPRAWAADKIAHAVREWNGDLGTQLRAMVPIVFPGMDPTAWAGFAQNGAQYGNTAAANANSFAEMGWLGVTGGPKSSPAPAGPYPNPQVQHDAAGHVVENDWLDLHADPLVKQLLGGRPATMVHNAWQRAAADQIAVGLVANKQHRDRANALLPVACRSTEIGSAWSFIVT